MQLFKLGEIFCGPGGLALGAFQAFNEHKGYELKHAWANDIDMDSCRTYAKNICNSEKIESVICSDVRNVKIETLSAIDIFAFGFPCNDFSIVGEQKGLNGSYGGLYEFGIEMINFHKPKIFVAENVGGIASANEGNAFKKIINDLRNAGSGYEVCVHLYKSELYGIPQTRHRYIIVGFEKSLNKKFLVPAPTYSDKYVTVSQALSEIPDDALNNEKTKIAPIVEDRLRHIKPGENVWNADLPIHLRLNVKSAKLSQIYRRLHPDMPSYTITGSGGGGTHGYHHIEPRPLTNRERARLQTFPDDYEFLGSKESVRKQIGMAVPPLLSKTIFSAIIKILSGDKYNSIDSSYNMNYSNLRNNIVTLFD